MATELKSYTFRVVLEKDRWPDEPDDKAVWHAHVPALEEQGASTWGNTKVEALKNIQDVLQMILEEFAEEGKPIPESALLSESKEPLVTVTLT